MSFRILCVDDNRDFADTTAMLLRLVGFDARACYDGDSAVREVDEFSPNICLIDLHMPGMSGTNLAGKIIERKAFDLPYLIAVTAMGEDSHRALTKSIGFDLHLVKPVSPVDLVGILVARSNELRTAELAAAV